MGLGGQVKLLMVSVFLSLGRAWFEFAILVRTRENSVKNRSGLGA